MNVINHGSVPVSYIDYSYTLDGKESSGSLHLDNPVDITGAYIRTDIMSDGSRRTLKGGIH